MPPKLVLVAQVGGAFGVRGEARITAFTATPQALLAYRNLLRADGSPGLTLTSGRPAKAGLVVRAAEITSKEEADALRGLKLYVPREALPPAEEDEFYLIDLVGLEARDAGGQAVGRVVSVQNFGADDLLEIKPDSGGASWWLPFTREAAPEVRLEEGWLTVVRPVEIEGEPESA